MSPVKQDSQDVSALCWNKNQPLKGAKNLIREHFLQIDEPL
jgi:hypothetical protein